MGIVCVFPWAQIEQVQMGKAAIEMSAEMKQNRETWVAKWGATTIGGASTIYFDEAFMMGSNDKSLHSHIWGLEDVLPGHIFTQGTMMTKMFLDIYTIRGCWRQ